MIILAVLVAHNIFNGHFYIHQTDWTSSLNLTDIPWIVEVVHLSLQISSSRFNCTRFLNYFICMHHWKIQKKIHLSDMIIQRWLLHVIFRPILWTHQFCDPALWWWHSARRGRIRRTNQLNQPWLIDWLKDWRRWWWWIYRDFFISLLSNLHQNRRLEFTWTWTWNRP